MECNIKAIALAHSSFEYWISACDILTIFQLLGMGLSCSRKQHFAAGTVIQTESHCANAYSSATE